MTSKHSNQNRRSTRWDVIVSVALWLVTLLFVLGSALLDFVALAFLDACPTGGCAVGVAIGSHLIAWILTLGLTVFSAFFIIGRVRAGERAWKLALGMLGIIVGIWALGFVIATIAVGGWNQL